ncbi:hypothetical protein [Falsiroseomonas oryzae]|uniref:hypothetical protein n=1 Tax=Falsiroseomonas oryzae TaxID=2766473 RepID=UPI0022EA4835|nr:hypothetical protein [Roseomonas sp. MO-31]
MPTDGTGTEEGGDRPQAGGFFADARLLAGLAGGLAAACLALWAFRGLPLGLVTFWAAPLPVLMAGMGFGAGAAMLALVVAAGVVWLAGSLAGVWLFLLAFGIPALLLVAASRRGLGLPLALLGLLPAGGILLAAWWLSDMPGGMDGVLRALAETGLRRFDLPASAAFVADIVRVKAAAIGFWLALALLANGWVAGWLLARAGVAPAPAWSSARLPGWYAALPALALGFWLAAETGADAVPLSLLLVLLVPLMLHGLAVLHTRTLGRGERPLVLGAVYVALVVLFLPASLAVAGYGAFDLLLRTRGRGAPPSRS